jgi:hypothetical protein
MNRQPPRWSEACQRARSYASEPLAWYPYPAAISFFYVLLLTAHVIFGTTSRLGMPSDVITFPSDTRKDSAIWLSVTPIGKEIVVATADRKVFRWPQEVHGMEPLKPFIAYLKGAVAKEVEAAALQKAAFQHQTTAVIAADQRLKYLHVRPLLYAFAAAGIADYAFETQNPLLGDARP